MNIRLEEAYKTRMGKEVKLVASFKGVDQKMYFRGDNGETYDSNGKVNPLVSNPVDLVSGPIIR